MAGEVVARVVLDWRGPQHWSAYRKPCRICHGPTNMRDEQGRPCDKTCAEGEIAREMVGAASRYFCDERIRPFDDERIRPAVGEVRRGQE